MKCCAIIEIIDGYEVVIDARERTVDPEGTARNVREKFPHAEPEELEGLFRENTVYAPLTENQRGIPDGTCHEFREKLASLGEHERLVSSGAVIPDLRGAEYYLKTGGRWEKGAVGGIGVNLPPDAFALDGSPPEIREEIAAQDEADRVLGLSPEDRGREKQAALDALADETVHLESRYRVQGKDFDSGAYYEEKKLAIEAKYGEDKV